MAKEKAIIRTQSHPTIVNELDDISIPDTDGLTPHDKEMSVNNIFGNLYPMIQINGKLFEPREVLSMVLDCTGFIPIINVTIATIDSDFLHQKYPKDGDIISLMIRSKSDAFKLIRNDYEITDVDTSTQENEGILTTTSLTGTMRIPKLYGEFCEGIDNTAYNSLLKLSNDLKLGFASNEKDTKDKMKWICPFDTYERFIHDIANASYKDEQSFFTCFIDQYYYLNYVNINNQFSENNELIKGLAENLTTNSFRKGTDTVQMEQDLILTNYESAKKTNFLIQDFRINNNAGKVSMKNGYARNIQMYDFSTEQYWDIKIDPITTEGSEKSKVILKGRANENFYLDQNKYKWMGIQYSLPDHNVHENYFYAKVNNYQNHKHMNKITLTVKLPKANFNFFRYQQVPILLFLTRGEAEMKKRNLATGISEDAPLALNQFLSGHYVIQGMKYIYNGRTGAFTQELELTRREWPLE